MTTTALLLSILAAGPVERFARDHPRSEMLATPDGSRLLHASGFLADLAAPGPVEAARAFLAAQGAAFGVAPAHELVLKGAPAAGGVGAVRFERRIGGLPVFGGDLVVGVDGRSRVFAVNSADVPPATSGSHAIGESGARAAALASFPGGARGAGPASVSAGWRRLVSGLRAVYRVDFVAAEPPGDWRVFVDGETSAPLFREDLRAYASAPGRAYEVSPTETAAAPCSPAVNGGLTFCAAPVGVTMPNLLSAPPTTLSGTQSAVFNCRGANAPTSRASVPGPCSSVPSVLGGFAFAEDGTFASTLDDFAAAMAYYHLDRHATFFKALDPTLPGGTGRALNGSLPGLVNAFQGGAPIENAFYSGGLDAMVFGQGASADYAYDATVIYHELTHGAVAAWGGYGIDIDALGGLDEPAAVNEGTADSMAVSETGRSRIASFITSARTPASAFMRDLDDPTASRSCQGDGTLVSRFGASTVNGLDGEVHDDGEIWNGFFWEVYQGLEAAGFKGCGGACQAGPAIQYKAMQLAGGTSPTLGSYWQTFKAAASALFPSQPSVAAYVDCVARRRQLDRCDRTVPVFAGETKVEFVRLRWAPFQMVVDATGPTSFGICSAQGTSTTIHGRLGQPVALSSIDPGTLDATVAETDSALFAQACSGGSTTITLTAGTWYLLFESPAALVGNSPGFDVYRVDVAPTGVAPRPAAAAPPTCAIAPAALTIAPAVASVPPKGSVTFAASGGSGAHTWSLQTNASGGSIDASTGAYTAGATGGAIDVVKVVDAAATSATASVTVTAGVSIAPPSATVPPRGSRSFAASGGSGTGYAWSLQTSASGGLVDAGTGAYTAGSTGSVTDVLRVVDSLGNQATASATVTAGVSISPPAATVAPQGTQALTASGGSGTGYAWSLSANASGGSIDGSTGSYTAGATGGVTDTVQVTDSLGNRASASLTVAAVAGGPKKGCGCASGGDPAWALGLGLLALLGRRRGARRSRR